MRIISGVLSEPDVHWIHGDGLCDCLFQNIYDVNNSYLGRTMRVRLCCIWADIYKQYPQFVQVLPFYDRRGKSLSFEEVLAEAPAGAQFVKTVFCTGRRKKR